MKTYIYLLAFGLLLGSCQKSELQLVNPNQPTPTSLTSEAGIEDFAMGVYQKSNADVPGEGGSNIWVIVMQNHSVLGDEIFVPWGNFGWRWTSQVYSVTLPNGTVVVNPFKVTQEVQLKSTNSRQAGERNSFMYEWELCYFIIGQCNALLQAVSNPALQLSGDAATKKNTLKAWALWWKGFAYSRIGSMYIAGLVNNEPANGNTNGKFLDHNAIIVKADSIFGECLSVLGSLQNNTDYQSVMTAIIPNFNDNKDIITPEMWKRQIYSYEARNLIANKKVKDMGASDWNQVLTLTGQGLQKGDNVFWFGMDPAGVNDLSGGFWHPFALIGDGQGFAFSSERLVQDFKPGDNRFTNGFQQWPTSNWQVNIRGRGLQYGTRWDVVPIENGGLYATNNNVGKINLACTYEENALMTAEAKIHTGDIEGGLQLIDAVRDYQNSGLAHVAGTGLTQAQALEELRRERRIGLYMRGVAFYDARRWGITAPASQGGGRANAIVLVPGKLVGASSPQALPCFMDYDYLDYWDVPQNELDFNSALAGSAPVAN